MHGIVYDGSKEICENHYIRIDERNAMKHPAPVAA
jgi:hypothetical protein